MHRLLLVAAAALGPAAALAADIGWYVGAGAGGTRLEEDLNVEFTAENCNASNQCTVIASKRLDKFNGTDLGFRVFGGLRFGRFFGIEGGYVDLGEPEDEISLNVPQYSATSIEQDVQLVLTDEIDGWEVFGLAAFPLNDNWEVFAKLGIIAWDSDFTLKNAADDTYEQVPNSLVVFSPPTSKVSDDGTDLAGGFGFNYKATERMTLRGEGTWYDIDDTEQAWMLGFSVILNY